MTAVDYGATTEGVNGFLQWNLFTSEQPSVADVEQYLATATFEVAGRIGPLTGLADSAAFIGRAAYAVELFAAATAQGVVYPEIAGRDGSYAKTLWDRYAASLTQLAVDVQQERDTGSTVDSGVAGHGFPAEALVKRDMGF